MKRRLFSLGFLCTLAGIAVTLLAYSDIWFWPAWPAFTVVQWIFRGRWEWTELSYGVRAAVLVGLIAFNIAFWSAVAWLAWWLGGRIRSAISQ
jgi:hypothetical protein